MNNEGRAGMTPAQDGRYIQIRDLTCDFGTGRPAVDRLSFDIHRGEFIGLLGPSGCGKSTTLRMVAGLIEPTGGDILLDGQSITARPPWERNLGLVFQNYALFPHMSVAKNVAFGLKLRKLSKTEIAERVDEALHMVRLEGYGGRRPRELSGGQQQRVALARSIVIRPSILLLDEPLSNLDAKLRDEMRVEIREIQKSTGITTLFVTHDQQEALTMCDRIAVMNAGRLEQIGTPEDIYDRAETPFVAGFIGQANRLECRVVRENGEARLVAAGRTLPTPAALPQGENCVAMVRPHAIRLAAPSGDALVGEVTRRTYIGNIVELEIAFGEGGRLTVELRPEDAREADARPGRQVGCLWNADNTLVFAQ